MKEKEKNGLRILFIGNSHTYYNDLPLLVKRDAEAEGYDCSVTMLAHPCWYLEQHAAEPEVRFNILYGDYDYVVLQEYAQPFGPAEKFRAAAAALNEMIRTAGSTPVLYECWAAEAEPDQQAQMNRVSRLVAEEIGALFAPVGERWWGYREAHPEQTLYDPDGEHASPSGSGFAAGHIWAAIRDDLVRNRGKKH